jgi:DNA replication and repair protein RecF
MHLAHLSLTSFRNYTRLELPLTPGITVITGDNAQGKSNLLEAILFLATTKSFRAGSDRELISWLALGEDNSFTRVAARLHRESSLLRLEILIREEARAEVEGGTSQATTTTKRVLVNGIPRRAIDLIGQANVVMFSPQDIELVAGPPQLRRRYLDVTISQVDPRYVRTLAHYNKVLAQRNHLLRQIRERHSSVDQLLFWDQELANAGAYILVQRLTTVEALNALVRDVHRNLTASKERLRLLYRSTIDNGGNNGLPGRADEMTGQEPEHAIEMVAGRFLELMRRHREREIAYGASLSGPHRDDFCFIVDDRELGVYGSRGQQRTAALSLKLAEATLMQERSGEAPIVLLDDIMSELDRRRAHSVLEALAGLQQVLITAIDPHAFEASFLTSATVLQVEQGTVARLDPRERQTGAVS